MIYLLRKAARQLQGRTEVHGLPISIENRRGSIRQWTNPDTGKEGMTRMIHPYGYFTNGTLGSDGDALDCYVGPNRESRLVVIVHSTKAPDFKEYDEDKTMLGFDSVEEATASYLQHFDDPRFFGGATVMDIDEFRATLPECKGEKVTGGRFITTQELEEAAKRAHPHGLEGFAKAEPEPTESDDTGESPAIQNFKALWKQVTSQMKKSGEEACKKLGDKLGVDWKEVDLDEFCDGMFEEEEHKDITHGSAEMTAKIVLAHLKEDKHYYSKLDAALKKSHVETVSRKPTVRHTAHGVYLVRNTTAKVHKSDKAATGISGKNDDELKQLAAERGFKVPPAWTDVWLNSDPEARLQVKGRDKKGVLQRLYSSSHHEEAAVIKFDRVKKLAKDFKKIMATVEDDLKRSDAAKVIYLMAKTGMRLGSEKVRGEEKAFGASNIMAEHTTVNGNKVTFDFTGKKGVNIVHTVSDPKIAAIVSAKKKGRVFTAGESDVKRYMTTNGFDDYTSKDFRTLMALSVALKTMKGMSVPKDQKEYNRSVRTVCKAVAEKLGNTPAVAKGSYIPPEVFSAWTI